MALDPVLTKIFPRDFKNIPLGKQYAMIMITMMMNMMIIYLSVKLYPGTEYGVGSDESLNKEIEDRKLQFLEDELFAVLKQAVQNKERPMFTTALIAGEKDCS